MTSMICAQTHHNLSAIDIINWLENPHYMIHVVGLQVYGYWMEGRDGEKKEGYYWVAEIKKNKVMNTALGGGSGLRIYNGRKYFTVKNMLEWPKAVRFRVSWDRDVKSGNPIIHSTYGNAVKFPYSYNDMCVARREEEENLEVVVEEPMDRKKELVMEILSKMEELKGLI